MAKEEEGNFGSDARILIEREFYVDDVLKLFPTETEAIHILGQAQEMLAASNLRLNKLASNQPAVIEAFPPEECCLLWIASMIPSSIISSASLLLSLYKAG